MNMGEYVDTVMAAVTARMEGPRRAHENINMERAPVPVTATFVHPVDQGVNTTETCATERDAESHRSNANGNTVLNWSQWAERKIKTKYAQMSDPGQRDQLQVIDGVYHAVPISFDDVLEEEFR